MENIVITGGCGFIGTALTIKLIQSRKYNVRIIDNLSVGNADWISKYLNTVCEPSSTLRDVDWSVPLQIFKSDITDFDAMNELFCGANSCVHLAANTGVAPSIDDPVYDCKTNVLGTLSVLEAARHNQLAKFVFASSGAPLGEQEPPLNESCVPNPTSPYGASKLSGEGYCSAYFTSFALNTIALRFGNVYGPGSWHKSSAVAKFIKLALQNKTIEIYGDGNQTRDFIYISDLIGAIEAALLSQNCGGEIFQIATFAETSINEMIDVLRDCFARTSLAFPDVIYSEKRVGDVRRNYSDTTKAKTMLNWQPELTLQEGVSQTLTYFLKEVAQ